MSDTVQPKGFVFTGKHMLAIMVAFFGVIISVNVLMAYYANTTWSGLVVANSYVASQEFNEKAEMARKWQQAGIKSDIRVAGRVVTYQLTHPGAALPPGDGVLAAFRRPVGDHQDFVMTLSPLGNGRFEGNHPVLTGEWIVDLTTMSAGKTIYHEARRIHVGDGAI